MITKRWVWLAVAMLGCGGDDVGVQSDAGTDAAPTVDAPIDAGPPRALPDLRFKYANAFFPGYTIATEQGTDGSSITVTPFPVAPVLDSVPANTTLLAAFFSPDVNVEPVSSTFEAYPLPGHEADLAALAGSGVLTSLDYPSGSFIATQLQGSGMTFDLVQATSNPAALGSDVAAQAATAHICTAVAATGSGSDVALYCYADTASAIKYEEVALIVDEADVGEQASLLAGSGYTITAFGRASTAERSYAIVGTRIAQTMEPLGMLVVFQAANAPSLDAAFDEGFVPMGGYMAPDGTLVYLFQE